MRVQMHLRTAAIGKCTVSSSSSSSASLWRTRFLLVDQFRQQRPLHVPSLAVALSHLHINQSIFSDWMDIRHRHSTRSYGTKKLLKNNEITAEIVQLIDLEGKNLGTVAMADARKLAKDKGCQILMVHSLSNPPVCKLTSQIPSAPKSNKANDKTKIKEKSKIKEKELRFSDSIDEHDVQTKVERLRSFLEKGIKVKLNVFFKKPGQFDTDLARALLDNISERVEDVSKRDGDINVTGKFASLTLLSTLSKEQQLLKKQKRQQEEQQQKTVTDTGDMDDLDDMDDIGDLDLEGLEEDDFDFDDEGEEEVSLRPSSTATPKNKLR